MPALRDLKGQVFGYLTVLRRVANQGSYVCWEAKCVCGELVVKQARDITLGANGSCGCKTNELRSKGNAKHRMSNDRAYKSWAMMKQRCLNPKYSHYDYYGGRGIKIHQPWVASFETFLEDMGFRPEGTSLDRRDSDADYTPANCRWATSEEQSDNKRNARRYFYKGSFRPLKEIAALNGTTRARLYNNLYKGYSLKQSIEKTRN